MMAKKNAGRQVDEKGAEAKEAESSVQVGMNLETIMASRRAAAEETEKVFGLLEGAGAQTFLSMRTPEGDRIIMRAHEAARDAMKALCPHLKVGATFSLHDIQAQAGGEGNAEKEWDEEFLHYLPYIQKDDFVGVQNYTRSVFGPEGLLPTPEGAELTQMNYEFYPEALESVVRKVAQVFKRDILITENGIATGDDARRIEFIRRALKGVGNCMDEGIPVKGYLHWSLIDNFEWQKGFGMTFGLIAVDCATQIRTPKPSLAYLGSCKQKDKN